VDKSKKIQYSWPPGRKTEQAKNQSAFFGLVFLLFLSALLLLFFIVDLKPARREEANEVSSAWFLSLFALLCINRQFLWGLTSRVAAFSFLLCNIILTKYFFHIP
jgi:Na+/melibiose symporter-like transporter